MRPGLARALYSSLLTAALPLVFARYAWRARAEPAYGQHWAERLGRGGEGAGAGVTGRLWLHAVSLGETRAAAPLIAELREQHPGLRLLLTHGTATGREAGAALLREGDAQAWLPLDVPFAVRAFLRQHRPCAGVVMETEVWPNLLHAARAAGVPMVLANARLSAKSARQGERFASLLHPAVAAFTTVLAQTQADAQRLREAGARAVQVVGNLKFDMTPDPAQRAQGRAWRAAAGRPVLLAASWREGEDEPLLAAWRALPAPRPLLVLVPRHPQRFDAVAAAVQAAGLRLSRRSRWGREGPDAEACAADVWLGDSLGEMALYAALGHLALLGGSWAPLGGQNLIEIAAAGCPLLLGPHTFNFADAAERALAAGAAERCNDLVTACARAQALLPPLAETPADAPLAQMAVQAERFGSADRGAAARMAQALQAVLPR